MTGGPLEWHGGRRLTASGAGGTIPVASECFAHECGGAEVDVQEVAAGRVAQAEKEEAAHLSRAVAARSVAVAPVAARSRCAHRHALGGGLVRKGACGAVALAV